MPAQTDSNKAQVILHPTDFSPASEIAMAHALRLAITNQAELRIFHVGENAEDEDWERLPSVRKTLSRWGKLPEDAERSEVAA